MKTTSGDGSGERDVVGRRRMDGREDARGQQRRVVGRDERGGGAAAFQKRDSGFAFPSPHTARSEIHTLCLFVCLSLSVTLDDRERERKKR